VAYTPYTVVGTDPRQSACRSRDVSRPPGPRLPFQPQSITALLPVPSYTETHESNLSRVVTWKWNGREWSCWSRARRPNHYTPPCTLYMSYICNKFQTHNIMYYFFTFWLLTFEYSWSPSSGCRVVLYMYLILCRMMISFIMIQLDVTECTKVGLVQRACVPKFSVGSSL